MAIKNLNADQKEAFKAIQKFIDHPAANTFVLKGYAGTGKTYLMQYLATWLQEKKYKFCLLASTGRAATVLKGKTGFEAKTVHSELYHFSEVNGDEEDIPEDASIDKYGQMTLQFRLRQPDKGKMIYIIDESSMLSSELAIDIQTVSFGSGYLLQDFFEAAGNNKIIFVGDPGQLPPVGQHFSPALDMDWLAQQNRIAITLTLERIERQDPENDILILASNVRSMSLRQPLPRFPRLPATNMNNVRVLPSQKDLFEKYLEKFKAVGANGALAVARSNKLVNSINRAVRRDLYGELDLPLRNGEILMVVQNNYSVPLTNGDFVIITSLGEIKLQADLKFQSVRVKALASDQEYELLLAIDILNSTEGNFNREQLRSLMVDFSRRMKKKGHKPNSPSYKEQMMKDSYLNSLRAKYGYAVTCHKAQGGEWDDIFLFLEKSMYRMPGEDLFRWWYTAITRARKVLNVANDWWIQ